VPLLLIAIALVLLVAPLAFAAYGWRVHGRGPRELRPPVAWDWRMSAASLLFYVLAFNLTFFVQELFLVLPKAFVPGLQPVLYHNNHGWTGSHPLAELFQGTGALATLLLGLACALRLRGGRDRAWVRLLLFWLAFCGMFMALPQMVMAALLPQGDVGRAMAWLGWGEAARTVVALVALAAMPACAFWLMRPLLALVGGSAGARHRRVFLGATLPALLAIVLIVPFRMPREWIEVLLVPLIVTLPGLVWLQAGAWVGDVPHRPGEERACWPLAGALLSVLVLLAVFHLVLKPGIAF
jgi:hypothetical protein